MHTDGMSTFYSCINSVTENVSQSVNTAMYADYAFMWATHQNKTYATSGI